MNYKTFVRLPKPFDNFAIVESPIDTINILKIEDLEESVYAVVNKLYSLNCVKDDWRFAVYKSEYADAEDYDQLETVLRAGSDAIWLDWMGRGKTKSDRSDWVVMAESIAGKIVIDLVPMRLTITDG